MSEYIATISGQINWAVRNLAFNLDFIPDDKLAWKPAPDANSALEIVAHLVGAFDMVGGLIRKNTGGATEQNPSEPSPITNRDEAKSALLAAAQRYVETLSTLGSDQLNQLVEMPFGKMPIAFLANMGAVDSIHHHGQIAYIQTLLGDTEPHFDFSLLPKPQG